MAQIYHPNHNLPANSYDAPSREMEPICVGLARGIVNHRALARWIQETSAGDASFDAILSTILVGEWDATEAYHTLESLSNSRPK